LPFTTIFKRLKYIIQIKRADGALKLRGKIISLPLIILSVSIIIRMLFFVGAGAASASEYALNNFPYPFVSETGSISNTLIVIPVSDPHGPCGPANTMDTMGGILIACTLGSNSTSGTVKTAMDTYSYVSIYNSTTAQVTMIDTTSNIIVIGGPGVNQVAYYYNGLTYANGTRVLPVIFLRDASGDYLYVQSSKNVYRMDKNANGQTIDDYGVIQLYKDGNRYILLVYGLGGEGTFAAANVLSEFKQRNLTGMAVVVKYYDSNGTATIVESVSDPPGTVSSIAIYQDSACTVKVSSVNWGTVEPGSSKSVTVYVKNIENEAMTLSLKAENWSPSNASNYMSLSWDYNGQPINRNTTIKVTLTLNVYANITGITNFNFDVVITGVGS
jgi:hypothetical protein